MPLGLPSNNEEARIRSCLNCIYILEHTSAEPHKGGNENIIWVLVKSILEEGDIQFLHQSNGGLGGTSFSFPQPPIKKKNT